MIKYLCVIVLLSITLVGCNDFFPNREKLEMEATRHQFNANKSLNEYGGGELWKN